MLCVCTSASDFYAACPVVTEITCGFLKYVVSLILLGVGLSQSNTALAQQFVDLCCVGDLEDVRAAVQNGVDVNMKAEDGKTGLP